MKLFNWFSILVMIFVLSACGADSAADDKNKEDNDRGTKVQNVDDENNNSRMRVADKAQDKIENMEEVRHANVIVTENNAYVAVVLEDNTKGDVREDLEKKISDQVKSTDKKIRNVFVSSNPDFVDRMGDYGDKIQKGKPVKGLFEEFTEMVERVFPSGR
ncbi:YhcN/YlaJ family sporulation lipoprotein [Robertmurraya korlensis]|uniref:YhcN/YlaJ family sporulation lipoprotein n=1 Tax=Robertmurraya korlensis TaxID=519977 RepID=UPI00203D4D97|nr:YhcN/YlaJ family sporulation lipoprotein [Robertmurraya korlensis]MCM3601278.1 YhcN/YlaJ family sporulation lipoprotein [Robertmurraya korlensis]